MCLAESAQAKQLESGVVSSLLLDGALFVSVINATFRGPCLLLLLSPLVVLSVAFVFKFRLILLRIEGLTLKSRVVRRDDLASSFWT
jgi:hypothetical protein